MNWWDKINHAVRRSHNIIVNPGYIDDDKSAKAVLTEPTWVSAPIYGSPRRIDYIELEQYEEDVTVAAAVNFIVDSIATCEWDIIPDEDMIEEGEAVDGSDAIKFFNSEDWEDSFEVVLRGVIADILHYDCGTMVVVFPEFCYDENKTLIKEGITPLQLRARDGRSFMRQVTPHGDIMAYWQYSFAHQAVAPIEFKPAEIIYVQERPSTRSPYGTSKLEIIKNIADLMLALQLGHRSAQENNLAIGGIISHADVTDPEKLRRLSAMYNSTLKGEANRKRWLTTGGNVAVTPINTTTMDDTWIGGAEFYQMQILSVYKVPKTVLGFTDSSTNRATSISQATTFKRMGVATMMTLLDRMFTREIVKKYFNEKLIFRFVREIDLTDEAIRADIDAKNVATGVRTVNELRTRDGLEEIEEPEEEEGGYAFDEYGEYEGMESLTQEEAEEIGKGFGINFNKTTVHVPASGGRKEYTYERTSAQTQHTDMLTTGIESIMYKREAMMQAGDVVEGIDPEIGRQRREVKAAGRNILISMDRKVPVIPGDHYTVGMKELVERGDIEKKKGGKGYKLTTQGKARVKEINEFALRATVNVPTKSESGAESHEKVLVSQYLNQMEYASRHLKSVEKSGGSTRVWVKPSAKRKGHWRNVKPGKGDDKKSSDLANLKSDVAKLQKESDKIQERLTEMSAEYRTANINVKRDLDGQYVKLNENKLKIDAQRDALQKRVRKIELKDTPRPKPKPNPKLGDKIPGFNDDFIALYDAELAHRHEVSSRNIDYKKADSLLKEYKEIKELYELYNDEAKYYADKKKYTPLIDARKRKAGIPIDPNNRTPVTDSSVFNLKEGKTNLAGMTLADGVKQLKSGGWNFEDAAFGMDEHDIDDTNVVVENGVVYGTYTTRVSGDSLELGLVQINADMKRQGYGKKIMGHVIQDALDGGHDKIILHSKDDESHPFYDAIGMRISPGTSSFYEGDRKWMGEYMEALKHV